MSATNNIVCTFYLRDGFCSKGNYCTFSHDRDKQSTCKFWAASGACRFGSKCSFLHGKKQTKATPSASTAAALTVAAAAAPAAILPPPPPAPAPAPAPSQQAVQTIDDLWDFSAAAAADSGSEGVYFYGAAGTASFQPAGGDKSYKKILGKNISAGDLAAAPAERDPLPSKPKQVCHFYASGNCRFGSACRNLHVEPEEPVNDANGSGGGAGGTGGKDGEPGTDVPRDCGICLAPPENGGLYGMMSHCPCVFCLRCIREWRSEGITVAHKSDQVRMCPLCRIESHFVVPTVRVVFGEAKDRIIASYKQSLKAKPCMHYAQDGKCPFGSSCFYKHVNKDGTLEEPTGPRIIMKEDSTTEIKGETKLFDFLVAAKRR